jgi:hypothetical protein
MRPNCSLQDLFGTSVFLVSKKETNPERKQEPIREALNSTNMTLYPGNSPKLRRFEAAQNEPNHLTEDWNDDLKLV